MNMRSESAGTVQSASASHGHALEGIDHVVVKVPDLKAGADWYKRFLGLYEQEHADEAVYLASPVTGRTVLGLTSGGTGLSYASFRAPSAASLAEFADILTGSGIDFERCPTRSRPGAIDCLRLTLPTGHILELLHAQDQSDSVPSAYRPGAIDVRISHLQLRTLDVIGLSNFLQPLGFKVTGFVPDRQSETKKHYIQFLRVNEYHHQLAVLTGPVGLHHVALEIDQSDFWKLCDHLAIEHIPAEYGPGRHKEGHFNFLYVRDPFGNRIEVISPMAAVGFDFAGGELGGDPAYHMNMWGPQPPETWLREWT